MTIMPTHFLSGSTAHLKHDNDDVFDDAMFTQH